MEKIISRLQYIGGFLYLAKVVIGSHLLHRKAQVNSLGFSRRKESCLCKSGKLLFGLSKLSLRRFKISLYHFLTCPAACVGYMHFYIHIALLYLCVLGFYFKCGVGQAEAERIVYLFRGSRYGFKITVAHINIVRVIHIIPGFMEIISGRIVLQRLCKGIGKLS